MSTIELQSYPHNSAGPEVAPFELDVRIVESDGSAATLINLTDNGCAPSCSGSCTTDVC